MIVDIKKEGEHLTSNLMGNVNGSRMRTVLEQVQGMLQSLVGNFVMIFLENV